MVTGCFRALPPPRGDENENAYLARQVGRVNAAMTGKVSLELRQGLGKLAPRPAKVPVPRVVQGNRGLDQSLQEKPVGTGRLPPELLPRVMRLEKEPGVEFFNTFVQQIIHPAKFKEKCQELQETITTFFRFRS
jgi:hypothetical protein